MIQLMLILSIFGDIISLSLPLKGVNEHIMGEESDKLDAIIGDSSLPSPVLRRTVWVVSFYLLLYIVRITSWAILLSRGITLTLVLLAFYCLSLTFALLHPVNTSDEAGNYISAGRVVFLADMAFCFFILGGM